MTKTKSTRLIVLSLVAGALLAPAIVTPAVAAMSSDEAGLRQWLSTYGVSEATQDTLVAKAEQGQLFDAGQSDKSPVSAATVAGAEVETFADGSVLVTQLEAPKVLPKGVVQTQAAIQGCTLVNGGGYATYSNCTIVQSNGTMEIAFTGSYQRYTGGAKITKASNPRTNVKYGSTTTPTVKINRATSTGSTEAYATAYAKFTSHNGLSSEDMYLALRVTSAKAWATDY